MSGVLVRDGVGGVVGDGVFGGWCARGIIIFQGVPTKLKFFYQISTSILIYLFNEGSKI